LRHSRFLPGGVVSLGVEFTGTLGIFALGLESSEPRFIDCLLAGSALDLLLLALVLVDLLNFFCRPGQLSEAVLAKKPSAAP
jgi:hypothetical protein